MTFPFDPRHEPCEPTGSRPSGSLAESFRDNADILLKLADMQATLEGSYYRAHHELQRVQKLRRDREEKANSPCGRAVPFGSAPKPESPLPQPG